MVEYNDDAAMEDKRESTPSFGVFNATVGEVHFDKDAKGLPVMKETKGDRPMPFYGARVVLAYKNEKGEPKKKSIFINCGLWKLGLIGALLDAAGVASKEGRTVIMTSKEGADILVGAKLVIKIAAKKEEKFQTKRRLATPGSAPEPFEGYLVGEFIDDNGTERKFIQNEVVAIADAGESIDFDSEFETSLRERFKNSGLATDPRGAGMAPAEEVENEDETDF